MSEEVGDFFEVINKEIEARERRQVGRAMALYNDGTPQFQSMVRKLFGPEYNSTSSADMEDHFSFLASVDELEPVIKAMGKAKSV